MSARPDADLVRAAQAGDVASFEMLYTKYARIVHAILLGRLPAADADDVTQNVFITAYTKLTSLHEPAAFAGALLTLAKLCERRGGELERMVAAARGAIQPLLWPHIVGQLRERYVAAVPASL